MTRMLHFTPYHEDPSQLHVGCEPNHAYFIPYSSRETALADDRTASEQAVFLDGEWDFRYYESLDQLLSAGDGQGFAFPQHYDTIPVPSCWLSLIAATPLASKMAISTPAASYHSACPKKYRTA